MAPRKPFIVCLPMCGLLLLASCLHDPELSETPRVRRTQPVKAPAPVPPPAPVAPPPPTEAGVNIVTEPPGATVLIDGAKVGRTPFRTTLAPGHYSLQLRLQDYKPVLRDLTLHAGPDQLVMEILVDDEASVGMLRVELPCAGPNANEGLCNVEPRNAEAQWKAPGKSYESFRLTLRVRGVMEPHLVPGCKDLRRAAWCETKERPEHDGNNLYSLRTSGGKTYRLNAGSPGAGHPFGVDYRETITVRGSEILTLVANSGDGAEQRNYSGANLSGRPILIPYVDPDPEPFDGQFVQVDLETMVRIKD